MEAGNEIQLINRAKQLRRKEREIKEIKITSEYGTSARNQLNKRSVDDTKNG